MGRESRPLRADTRLGGPVLESFPFIWHNRLVLQLGKIAQLSRVKVGTAAGALWAWDEAVRGMVAANGYRQQAQHKSSRKPGSWFSGGQQGRGAQRHQSSARQPLEAS